MQEVKLRLEVPEGFEVTGEYRGVENGEWYLGSGGAPMRADNRPLGQYVILRPTSPEPQTGEVWLEPTSGKPYMIVHDPSGSYASISLDGRTFWKGWGSNARCVSTSLVFGARTVVDWVRTVLEKGNG